MLRETTLYVNLTKSHLRRSLSMNICQPSLNTVEFMSSAESDSKDEDLLIVKYKRVQKASPFYETEFESIDQSVDVQISTFVFRVAPEPILTLYDFIITTFVPKSGQNAQAPVISGDDNQPRNVSHVSTTPEKEPSTQKIRVTVVLASVQGSLPFLPLVAVTKSFIVVLLNDNVRIATISLSTANATIFLRGNAISVGTRLGNLSFVDDSEIETVSPEFKHIMSIEGNDFADFTYQNFDPSDDLYSGINSKVHLSAGSIKFNFLERPLHDVFLFITKLTRLKSVYDAATHVAAQSASGIEKMQFDVIIKSPIIVFPTDATKSLDKLTMRLGEFVARNSYENMANEIMASLRGIQLSSEFQVGEKLSTLKMIDDINITAGVVQTSGINRNQDSNYPDVQVNVLDSCYVHHP
jgi:vacuolar protein sorting-associated protein 13A/C